MKLNPKRVANIIRFKGRSLYIFPIVDRALSILVYSAPFIEIYQITGDINPPVEFCLEVIWIVLITILVAGIKKLQNGEDETSLALLVKKILNYV